MMDKYRGSDGPNQNNCSESYDDYLKRAAQACEAGDLVLGMYLYLAAYEMAVADPSIPDGMAFSGLHEAWHLACDLKERSMAEYVFEKLEPFLMPDEIASYAAELQDLALDRLEEFGFTREELEDMANMISQDLMGPNGSVMKVESISLPSLGALKREPREETNDAPVAPAAAAVAEGEGAPAAADESAVVSAGEALQEHEADARFEPTTAAKKHGPAGKLGFGVASVDGFNPYDMLETSSVGTSYHAATNDGSGAFSFTLDKDRAAQSADEEQASDSATPDSVALGPAATSLLAGIHEQISAATDALTDAVRNSQESEQQAAGEKDAELAAMPNEERPKVEPLTYRNLVGYDEAISIMRDFGIGLQRDRAFQNFVGMLNARHGLATMPALDSVLFRAPAIEDATRFLEATMGEIALPALRMSMEENIQGMPVLCVSTMNSNRPRMNHAQNRFEGPGILVLDDLDMWVLPSAPEAMEGIGGFMMANISRGAREAVSLIRSAVEDPNVYVFATATTTGEVEPFFYELLEPLTVIDISNPTAAEREAIWGQIMAEHPSMRMLDKGMLTKLSRGLARYDIHMTAREAIEEAYKLGLIQRMFVAVTPQNVYDKLAACHAVDSAEYKAIEDQIIEEFRQGLDSLEDLIDGTGGLSS